jgi:hypothetical protein
MEDAQMMDTSVTSVAPVSVRALDEAVAVILENSFDQDSKVCIVTLMKLLDNLVHQPGNPKVRMINLANKAFHAKVGCRLGAVAFLQACGFQYLAASPGIGIGIGSTGQQQTTLVLPAEEESQSHLITARRLLMTRAISELGMTLEELPPYRPPPPTLTTTTMNSGASTARNNVTTTFNPYQGHRHDANSASVGTNLGPDANYVSTTDRQLGIYQRQQAALELKLQQPVQDDRGWIATLPPTASATSVIDSIQRQAHASVQSLSSSNSDKAPSDGALLASRAKRQHEERMQREHGGMTTKAMRDLERIKKQKVYAHVQLTIQFADGCKLTGKFLPKETIANVKTAVQECFVKQDAQQQPQQQSKRDFDLYVAPPRRLLPANNTLDQEGLVPAAKLFVSWKIASAPDKNAPAGSYLEPSLFLHRDVAAAAASFPSAQPVVGSDKPNNDGSTTAATTAKDKKAEKGTREEELLRRMMGGNSGGLGFGGSSAAAKGPKDKDGKPSGGGGGKPKWFK